MKSRIFFLCKIYVVYITVFTIMKPVFMLYNHSFNKFLAKDLGSVIFHGWPLDFSTAGYFITIPLLLTLVSIWIKPINWWRKSLTVYFAITAFFLSVILITDCVLYSFWGFKLDATVFSYLDSPTGTLGSISPLYLIFGFLSIILFSLGIFFLLHHSLPKKISTDNHKKLSTVTLLLLGGITFLFIRGGVGKSTMNIGSAYYSEKQFFNHAAVNPVFSLFASSLKVQDFNKTYRFYSQPEADKIFENLGYSTHSTKSLQFLNTKHPNILIIIIEGFAGTFIEPLGGEKGVTPQFNHLIKEGVFFTNFYANSFRTDRGTVCILSGYPSFPKISPMKIPEKSRSLPSIARSLSQIRYQTNFLYGGDINFTNMKSYLLSTGYQNIFGDTYFPVSTRHTHAWGVTDRITYDTLYNMVVAKGIKKPWFTTFLTLASHEPWIVPFHRKGLNKKANSMAYTDDCLGRFVEKIKKTPTWKNLLIICLPDHGIGYPEGLTEANIKRYHIPMLWLGGAIKKPLRYNRICSQTDLAATLLGQMNIIHKDFPFSKDVASINYKYPFALHTFDNGFAFIDSTGYTVQDFNSNKIITDKPRSSNRRFKLGCILLQKEMENFAKR